MRVVWRMRMKLALGGGITGRRGHAVWQVLLVVRMIHRKLTIVWIVEGGLSWWKTVRMVISTAFEAHARWIRTLRMVIGRAFESSWIRTVRMVILKAFEAHSRWIRAVHRMTRQRVRSLHVDIRSN